MRADHPAVLLQTTRFSPGLFSATFRAPDLALGVSPGQFVMLEVPDLIRPYLRRAYSVADARPDRGEVEFLVKAIGAGTAALEALPVGGTVRLLGPLGNGFRFEDLPRGGRTAIVAGGIGAGPFPFLFRALAGEGLESDFFLGGRTASDLAFRDRFAGLVGGRTHVVTDDGSLGERELVTAAFARAAAATRYDRVFACGPRPMFAALARIVADLSVPAEFSTEAEMGCGFGACLGCVIPAMEKPFLVSCTEGPILSPERIRW